MKAPLVRILDRPGGRAVLGAAASAALSVRDRAWCRVRREGSGLWVHRRADGIVVDTTIGGQRPAQYRAAAEDVYLHAYRPQPGDVVFDVGAGIGQEAALLSRLVGTTGRVIAIEASPRAFVCLEHLCRLAGLDNVTPLNIAIAATDGTRHVTDETAHKLNRALAAPAVGTIAVPARTLDRVAEETGAGTVDFIKMNIEGAEVEALQGMPELLSRVRHLAVGCHDFLATATGDESLRTSAAVRSILSEHRLDLAPQRSEDPRPWVRDYVYASRPD